MTGFSGGGRGAHIGPPVSVHTGYLPVDELYVDETIADGPHASGRCSGLFGTDFRREIDIFGSVPTLVISQFSLCVVLVTQEAF